MHQNVIGLKQKADSGATQGKVVTVKGRVTFAGGPLSLFSAPL